MFFVIIILYSNGNNAIHVRTFPPSLPLLPESPGGPWEAEQMMLSSWS